MDELVDQIASQTGIDRALATKAVGIIVNFLGRDGPQPQVQSLIDAIPGARELAEEHGGTGSGLMGVYGDLTAAGLGMGEIQAATRAFVSVAKAKVGEQQVDAVVGAIPGLGQFV
jgi:hypothetical protein